MQTTYKVLPLFLFFFAFFVSVYGDTKEEYLKMIDEIKREFVDNQTYESNEKIYDKSNDTLFSGVMLKGKIEAPSFLIEIKNGLKHGREFRFHATGALRSVNEYKEGLLIGTVIGWHKNGRLEFKREYVNGMKHGKYEIWYESGIKKSEINYENDKLILPYSKWFEDGSLNFKIERDEKGSKTTTTKYFLGGGVEEIRIDEVGSHWPIIKNFGKNGHIISLNRYAGKEKLEYIFDSDNQVQSINKYVKGKLTEKQIFDFDKKESKKIIYDKDQNIISEKPEDFLVLKYIDGGLK